MFFCFFSASSSCFWDTFRSAISCSLRSILLRSLVNIYYEKSIDDCSTGFMVLIMISRFSSSLSAAACCFYLLFITSFTGFASDSSTGGLGTSTLVAVSELYYEIVTIALVYRLFSSCCLLALKPVSSLLAVWMAVWVAPSLTLSGSACCLSCSVAS